MSRPFSLPSRWPGPSPLWRRHIFGPAALGLLGCTASEPEADRADSSCGQSGESAVGVIWSLEFGRISETQQTPGFDLDGHQTQPGDATGCGVADLEDPAGYGGIDNALGALISLLEVTEASATEALLEDGIRSGDLLLLVELDGIDHREDDPCVDLSLVSGAGEPLLSTQNEILAGQSFSRIEAQAGDTIQGLEMHCGQIEGRPISMSLPFSILGVELEIELSHGAIQTTLLEDGSMHGTIGAGLDVDYLLEIAHHPNVADEVGLLLEQLLAIHADLDFDGDGQCEQISASLVFEAAEAYLIE